MKEAWRDVPDYRGYYEVSDRGRVRSVARIVKRGSGTQRVRERILRPGYTKAGYPIVALFRNGEQHMAYVHHLVLEAFVGPRPPGDEGRHKNGIPRDCRLSNLIWGTLSENERDKERHGTSNHGARNGAAKITPDAVREIRKMYAAKTPVTEIGTIFGIHKRTVYDILQGRTWKHVK
jgi:hypothetical protein